MSNELIKEISKLQLLTNRYNQKLRMCPLEIKKQEKQAKLIFEYIKQLKEQNKKLEQQRKNIIEFISAKELSAELEIIEEEPKEIEKLEKGQDLFVIEKINELVEAVNELKGKGE